MKYISFIAFILLAQIAYAQPGLDGETTRIISQFQAKLKEADKVDTRPTLPEAKPKQEKYEYLIPKDASNITYEPPTIRPLVLPQENEKDELPFGFYAKLGFGYPISPLAEISYHNKKSDKFEYGLTYRHHSAISDNPIQYRRFSKHHANVEGTYYLKSGFAVGAHVGYDWNGLHFYGTSFDDSLYTKDDLHQRFSRINGGLRFFNGKPNSAGVNYGVNADFYHLSDKFKSKEFGFAAKASADKRFGEQHVVKIEAGLNMANFTDTATQKILVPYFRPAYMVHIGGFRARLGLYLAADEGVFITPDVELSYNFFNGGFAIFAGWNGDVRVNSFDNLTRYCPFLVSTPILDNTRWQERYGGIRGSFHNVIYEVRGAQKPHNVMPLFINDGPSDYGRFNVLYDTASVVTISASVTWNIFENFALTGSGSYNFFQLDHYDVGISLPNLDASMQLKYTWNKKLIAKAEFLTQGGINYISEIGETGVLNPLLDLNIGAEYLFTKNIGAFIDVNNLLNNKSQRFYRYPQFGINVMAGVTARW